MLFQLLEGSTIAVPHQLRWKLAWSPLLDCL